MTTIAQSRPPTAARSERVPPHNMDAEMSLLGAMMLDRDAIGNVLPVLNRDDAACFYRPEHEQIFTVLVDLYDANKVIDLVTVQEELQRRDLLEQVGGVPYIVQLAESVPSITNADHYARIVRDKGTLRDLIRCSDEITQAAYADREPTDELLDAAEQKFFAVTERRVTRQASKLRELLATLYEQVEQRREHHLSGLPTGFTELDDLTTGLQAGDFIIIAGRPSMGKTALGLTMCEHLTVNENLPVAFFSMEMSNQQVAQRILCSRGKIDTHQFRKGMIGEPEIERLGYVCEELANTPFFVDDTPGMSILELRAKARRLWRQQNIKAVFVDYIQLMRASGAETRQQEITAISGGLKALGRELNVPIVALAQLNRQSEGREGHRPRMSDLRESGALEQDADVILLIHREEYYKPQDVEAQGIAEVIVAKQRNGPTDIVRLHFNKRLTRFDNLSLMPEPAGYERSGDVPF